MAETASYVLLALLLGNPILMLITVLACRWYTLKAREVLKQVEALADEEVRRG